MASCVKVRNDSASLEVQSCKPLYFFLSGSSDRLFKTALQYLPLDFYNPSKQIYCKPFPINGSIVMAQGPKVQAFRLKFILAEERLRPF